ncbi:MAG: DUF4347 domain-containing protein [Richelia sp. SM1_7_0]|nr:DUF4347 domain-containing protein [Richelia sp. SM1_7_0]
MKLQSNQDKSESKSIVFIDATVSDYQSLIDGVYPGIEVVVLDSKKSGLEEITEYLQKGNYKSVHIVSHGSAGNLQWGKTSLNSSNLNNYTSLLSQWRNSLTDDADILLYGCDVASGEGAAFLRQLSEITQADIAASNDLTGSAILGGDWDLEVKTGEIESGVAFRQETIKAYRSILPLSIANSPMTVGSNPLSVSVGDFNGDGKLDLATANYGSNNVSILLGNGNGTFNASTTVAVGFNPYSVSVGDFNSDGKLDLATANYVSNNVSILLGNGNGTFSTTVTNIGAGALNPISVSVGDFNGDSKQDLATANDFSDNVSILLGNGNGTFSMAVTSLGVGASTPVSLSVGDFNGDGKQDLVTANDFSNNISILLGNGNGTFGATPNVIAVGNNPNSVRVADFNGDGKQDLAVTSLAGNNISILLGNGNGTFSPALTPTVAVGFAPYSVNVGDFNSDAKQDLAVANYDENNNNVSIFLGDGSGGFSAAPIPNITVGNSPVSVSVGDFNGDGKQDLVTANNDAGSISVVLNVNNIIGTSELISFQQLLGEM